MAQRTLPGQGLTGFWVLGYDGWKAEMDVNLLTLSTLVQLKVLDRVAALPGSPTDGDIYLLTATGDINKIAIRDDAAWVYRTPFAGWLAWVADEAVPYIFNGSTWVALATLLTGAVNAVVYMGVIDCSANPNYPAADAGEMYIVSVAGKIGGGSGVNVEAGDLIICKTDSTSAGTEAGVGSNWDQIQKNLDGAVLNTRQVLAGAGMTGGGDLSADRTLAMTSNQRTRDISFVIDGGGAVLTTGIKGDLPIDFAGTIDQVTTLADQSGSVVVDIWKDTYANYPPTGADSICASAKPTLSSATKAKDGTLTGWTTSIAAGDTLRFNVDSVTTITRVVVTLRVVLAT